jgi:transcriptional regulator with XRE-family HTH domain
MRSSVSATRGSAEQLKVDLGRELRIARKKAKVSGTELAKASGFSQSKISRIENGKVNPAPGDVEVLTNLLKVQAKDAKRLVELAEEIEVSAFRDWRNFGSQDIEASQLEVADRESKATRIDVFQPSIVPGLLQQMEYARSVLSMVGDLTSDDVRGALVQRVERQQILDDRNKELRFLISESALRNRVASADRLRMQIDRLRSLVREGVVGIKILPLNQTARFLPLHPFVIHDERLVSIELLHGELLCDEPAHVKFYADLFDRAWNSASTLNVENELTRISRDLQ